MSHLRLIKSSDNYVTSDPLIDFVNRWPAEDLASISTAVAALVDSDIIDHQEARRILRLPGRHG